MTTPRERARTRALTGLPIDDARELVCNLQDVGDRITKHTALWYFMNGLIREAMHRADMNERAAAGDTNVPGIRIQSTITGPLPAGWKPAQHPSYPGGQYYEHETAKWMNGAAAAWVGYSGRHSVWLYGAPSGTDRADSMLEAMELAAPTGGDSR